MYWIKWQNLLTVGKQSQRIETKPLGSKDHIFKDHSSDFLLFIDYSLFVFNDAFLLELGWLIDETNDSEKIKDEQLVMTDTH